MKTRSSDSAAFLRKFVPAWLIAAASSAYASTIWNGPDIGFYHAYLGASDPMTENVIITRGSSKGLYNSALETNAFTGISPKGTAWAIGTLSNYNTLTYGACPLEQGNTPPVYVGVTFVVHLITNDIYLQLTLTNWGGGGELPGQQTFGYIRSTPALPTPTISITNPASGAVFAAPANLSVDADASVSSGAVTNVQFFTNGMSCGSALAPPFSVKGSNLAAGAYGLTAVATAAGISATSSVVNVSVVNPVAVNLSAPSQRAPANFQFSYSANVGLSYVIELSTNLASADWIPLATNVAASNPVVFVDVYATNNPGFYRVGRLPNP